jgi:hypothetical protein
MDRTIIKKELDKLVAEANVSGEKVTKRAQKTSQDQNKAYYKDVEGKMKDYDKNLKQEDENSIDPVKDNVEGKEKEYHEDMEIMNGQEMIQYDGEPSDMFKDRAKKAIEGHATMGNDPEWANVVSADDQGFTGPDFGKDLVKKAVASKKKRNDATGTFNQFGDDIEMTDGKSKVSKKKIATESMKRIKFKSRFNGVGNALKLIPEAFKVDNKEFELTDGAETYRIKWQGTLSEGSAKILTADSKDLINEDFSKIKHLMGYKSENTLGTPTADERINENTRIFENATGVGFSSNLGNGFTNEGDFMVDEEVVEETNTIPDGSERPEGSKIPADEKNNFLPKDLEEGTCGCSAKETCDECKGKPQIVDRDAADWEEKALGNNQ